MMPLSQQPFRHFVIFDVETTGLSHRYGDRMIEIAALKISLPLVRTPGNDAWALNLKGMRRSDTFWSLLRVNRQVSRGAYLVNGITPQMIEQAPRPAKVLPNFMSFIKDACLIGHNISFDLGFLVNELSLLGLMLKETAFLDTIRMSRRFLPELQRHSLACLARSLGVEQIQEHRAMSDVEMTYQVFRYLLAIADRRDCCTIEDLLRLCGGRYSA